MQFNLIFRNWLRNLPPAYDFVFNENRYGNFLRQIRIRCSTESNFDSTQRPGLLFETVNDSDHGCKTFSLF